jgi:sugar/nucleoside kinase (ribokinase family)
MNFVVLGNVCIDHNRTNDISYEAAGGPPTFLSLFLNQTKDALLTTISSYGSDFLLFKNSLNLYPLSPNTASTLVYENTMAHGKRSQKCYFYKEALPPEINQDMTKIIKEADVLFITPLIPYFSPEYIKNVAELTSKDCLKIFLPQGYFRQFDENDNVVFREFEEADEILPLVDFVILSNEDYPNIENLSFKWNKKYNTTFIVTEAEKGAVIIAKNDKILVSTNSIPFEEIVDSIGAGEIFTASFAYNYFKNKDIERSVKLANESAREKLLAKTEELQKNLG